MKHGIGERIESFHQGSSVSEQILYHRHRFAYEQAKNLVSGKKVLEIGCGTAYGTELLAQSAKEVVALDIDADLMASLSQSSQFKIRFLCFDGQKIPFPDQAFDVVLAFQVLEHVQDDVGFLREIRRVLSPKGMAILTTPNRLLRLLPGQKPFNAYHVREYSPQDLRNLMEREKIPFVIKGVFGDPKTQEVEEKRLRKYHTFFYRHVFQRLPKAVQQGAKSFVLSLNLFRSKRIQAHEFRFFLQENDLDQSIDLWLELLN